MSATVPAVAKVTTTIVAAAHATITATMPAVPKATAAAASVFDKGFGSPVKFDSSNPLVLFIVQAFIIVALSRLLHFFLRYLRQPKVIAEVIAGILIGPSAMGRIPGFTSTIFPAQSVPFINLVANLGLVLFLFLVGIEVDFSLFRRNAKLSSSISLVGLVVPFALGAAISKGIYERFIDDSKVHFGTFLLFVATAMAITAFPNYVGVVVLSAGVGNDVVGWVLLALAIALTNASTGLIVLYVLLTAIGWILLLWFVARPILKYLGRKTRSFGEHGPSQSMTAFTLFLVLTSAWITDRIGIHAIFGAFLVGLVVPKEIRGPLTEKIEDLVTVLFLPLYFALSGLKTDLGLLKDGSIWGWTFAVIIVAFLSKFLSCGLVAKGFGLDWRESGAVGSLMACKGLVELIVLNVGLNAGILNPPVFAMFVVMALVTTFATTPLTLAFYPVWYRIKSDRERRGLPSTPTDEASTSTFGDEKPRSRFAVVVEQFEHLPAVMAFLRLVQAPAPIEAGTKLALTSTAKDEKTESDTATVSNSTLSNLLQIAFLRLVELTDRTSALLRAAESESNLLRSDALSTVVRAFANGLGVKTRSMALAIVAQEGYSRQVAEFAEESESEVIVLPWALPVASSSPAAAPAGSTQPQASTSTQAGVAESWIPNPLEAYFNGTGSSLASTMTIQGAVGYASYLREVYAEATCDVAVFIDRSDPAASSDVPTSAGKAHLFLAFHGGSDDRLALGLLVQLISANPGHSATVIRIERAAEPTHHDREVLGVSSDEDGLASKIATRDDGVSQSDQPLFTIHGGANTGDTVYPTLATGAARGVQSETEDDVLLARFFGSNTDDSSTRLDASVRDRIDYSTVSSSQPLHFALARLASVRATLHSSTLSSGSRIPLVVFAGRGRRDAPSHKSELTTLLKERAGSVYRSIVAASEVRRALGDTATALVLSSEEGPLPAEERIIVVQRSGKRGRVPGTVAYGAGEMAKAAAAHGKPQWKPRNSSPSPKPQPKKVAQGLPADHPLVAWREEQLREGNAPKELGAGHDFWMVQGVPENEGSGRSGTKGVVLGVADGVGGWEESGVDPSHFSQALMWFARERISSSQWTLPEEGGKRSGARMKELLDGAYKEVMAETGIVAGSSTACLVALDAETGMLHAANLGDSGFYILRPVDPSTLPPTPPPSPSADGSPSPAPPIHYKLHHAQEPQVYFFNAPRQMSKIPQAVLDKAKREGKQGDLFRATADEADTVSVQLKDGDIVMLVTDGYSDNIWAEGETDRLVSLIRTKVASSASPSSTDSELASAIAQTAVNFARMVSFRKDAYTPFCAEAKRWKIRGMDRGGKVDDVTVVVAIVRKQDGEEEGKQ
ncbi:K(+)/H(+) antiporter 1 [Rhodotorula toruloides]|nr:K(+)/H(+) antiporter 1 [Rhodotorula toruloides]